MASNIAYRPPTWYPPVATPWENFRRSPACFLARWLYKKRRIRRLISPSLALTKTRVSIVCISDTHMTQPDVPDGDILLHAGDLTNRGTFEELQSQLDWLKGLPHRYKVVIAGNHDLLLDPSYVARFPDRIYEGEGTSRSDLDWGDIIYLNNSTAKLEFPDGHSLKVYGSPWTEQFGTWAFQYPPIRQVWAESIPPDTDIVLTHGPPKGHLDLEGKGCPQLLKELWRIRPRLVVFGHIHDGHGREEIVYDAVEAAYDRVMMEGRGIVTVGLMAFWALWSWLWDVLCLPRSTYDGSDRTHLINAAIVGGRLTGIQQPAIVVEI
ncbi:putative calcineurin-like phosphoesterase [Mariannaea sp. PMI_226]|nr:putative calcineurin-like phosphoesterase [Mariannaea sp. PMI_226]